MELFLRQQFDVLLQEATGNCTERIVHHMQGPEAAIAALQDGTAGPAIDDFVDAFFSENLLDSPAGCAFVLEALHNRTVPPDPGGTVSEVLGRQARAAFAELLSGQVSQAIQRQQIYS